MIKSFKYRIYPTRSQQKILETTLDECRWLYNYALNDRRTCYELDGKSPSYYSQSKTLPYLKESRDDLCKVNYMVLQNVLMRLDLAFQAFFRRIKNHETPGYPRFKSKNRYNSITFPKYGNGFSIKQSKLYIQHVGLVKIKLSRETPEVIKICTILRSSTNKWYAIFTSEVEQNLLPQNDLTIGIDVGLKTFATLSDSSTIDNPKFFVSEQKELGRYQRKAAKYPERRRQYKKVVARIHERIKNKRDNFSHQESRRIVNKYNIICVEDLTINRMMSENTTRNKNISDAAWSSFFDKLQYKAEDAGRMFIRVNPAYTSQTCSSCGFREHLELTDREFNCSNCGLILDRDLNAANNILAIGLYGIGVSP